MLLVYTDLEDWTGANLQSKKQSKEESGEVSRDTHVEFCELEGFDRDRLMNISGYSRTQSCKNPTI